MTIAEMPQYASYIDSGFPLIGQIPEFWKINRLKVCLKRKITDGPHETPIFLEEGVPFLSVDGIQDGNLLFEGCRFVSKEAHEKYSKKCMVEKNDILMGKAASTGKIARVKVDFPFSIWSPLALIKINPNIASPKFVEYALKSESSQIQIDHLCTSNTQKNISMDDIPKIRLCLPPIVEQMAIAEFLEKKITQLDQAIAIKLNQISLLKERQKILIQHAITRGLNQDVLMRNSGVEWIGDIPTHWEVRRSKFLFTQRKERAWKNDIQLSATQAYGVIPQDEYERLTGSTVVKIQFHLDKRKHVEKDDFVISMRSFQGGLERAWSRGCIRSSYVVLKPMESIDADFFGYLLKLPRYIEALQKTGNFIRDGQDLNFDNFSQVDLFIPPIREQRAIAARVKNIVETTEAVNSLQTKQIEKLKEYKMSLINSAVTGKIKITPEMVEG